MPPGCAFPEGDPWGIGQALNEVATAASWAAATGEAFFDTIDV